jgi:molybdenum cofactor sulfurtransferase
MLSASTVDLSLPIKVSGRKSLTKKSTEKNRKAYKSDFSTFRTNYPQYDRTTSLDILRKTEFGRIEKASEVYVDYMGGGLWPECLVAAHSAILQAGVFGNTHSDSPS